MVVVLAVDEIPAAPARTTPPFGFVVAAFAGESIINNGRSDSPRRGILRKRFCEHDTELIITKIFQLRRENGVDPALSEDFTHDQFWLGALP